MPLPVQCKISFSDHDELMIMRSCTANYMYGHAMQKWNTIKPEVFESDVGIVKERCNTCTHRKPPNHEHTIYSIQILSWTIQQRSIKKILLYDHQKISYLPDHENRGCSTWIPDHQSNLLNQWVPCARSAAQFVLLNQCAPCARSVISSSC
jgi:hypothetical protein